MRRLRVDAGAGLTLPIESYQVYNNAACGSRDWSCATDSAAARRVS